MKPNKHFVSLSLITALFVRLIFSLYIHPIQKYMFSDMQSYFDIALRIVKSIPQLNNVFYPPGYSIFLSILKPANNQNFFITTAILQSLFGVLSIYLLYQISLQVLKPKLSKLFLLILVFYYPFIDTTGYLLSENLAIFLIALLTWFSMKFNQTKSNIWLFLAGITVGLGSLVRANLLIIGFAILVWLIAILKLKTKPIAVFTTATLASLLIISVVYFKLGGQHRISSLNGGFVFMAGQCLVGHSYDSNGAAFGPPVYMQRGIDKMVQFTQPFTNSRYFYQQGLDCLKQRPIRILEKISENYYLFFGNVSWPTSNQAPFHLFMKASHIVFNIITIPGLFLAIFFHSHQTKSSRPVLILLWLLLATVVLTSTIFYADIRYRLPYDAIFILIALTGYQFKFKVNQE